jgi:NADH:ubiquinone oxidoreductase subunit F (NADH-binding)
MRRVLQCNSEEKNCHNNSNYDTPQPRKWRGFLRFATHALGQSAPNPVLSTLHYFQDEYLAHIRE